LSEKELFSSGLSISSPERITPSLVEKLAPKIEDYLNEKGELVECRDLMQAHVCFEITKHIYNSKMIECIKELGQITDKIKYYDKVLGEK